MKVTFEGTAKELLDLADVIEAFAHPIYTAGISKNPDTSASDVRPVQAGIAGLSGGPNVSSEDTNIPNRFREEGVQ